MFKFDRKKFFDGFKDHFDHSLEQSQVDGIEFLLTQFEQEPLWNKLWKIAYGFATTFHETGGSMQPVEEAYYLEAQYSHAFMVKTQKGFRYYPYFGRGYPQTTWLKNYKKADRELRRQRPAIVEQFEAESGQSFDLVNHPEQMKHPLIAFATMTLGMDQGWFTTKKLDDFGPSEFKEMRTIINGHDKATVIATYAQTFLKILKDSLVSAAAPVGGDDQVGIGSGLIGGPTPSTGETDIPTQEQQPTNPADNVAVEKETQVGFFAKIKLKIAGWFAYFGGIETVEKYKADIDTLGIPTGWIKYALVVGLMVFVIWLIYEAAAHLLEWYLKRKRTDATMIANANAPGKVLVVCPEDIEAFRRAGWTIAPRDAVVPPAPWTPEVQT
jgi:hypothetical protein